MTDKKIPVTAPQGDPVNAPVDVIQDVTKNLQGTTDNLLGEGTVDDLKKTANQVAGMMGQVTNVVGSQVDNFSQKIGGQDIVNDMTDIINPMKDMVMNILKIAFFVNPQKRISRGQYIIGSLSVFVIMGLFVSIFGAIVGPLGIRGGVILIAVPLLNLAVKRFHDLNKPARWAVTTLIPFVGWIMPTLFTGENTDNPYGPDPLIDQPTDLTGYIITALSLLVLSTIITTVMGFLGFRISEPDVDITNPDMIGEQVGDGGKNTFQQGKNTVGTTVDNTKNTANSATNKIK